MAKESPSLLAFNRGIIDPRGLARIDIKRIVLSAETMTNWMPRVLGSMALRVGWGYLGATQSNAAAKFLPFIFSTSDTALIELTDSLMRIWVGDALITRSAVATTITNGTFNTDITSWTDNDEVGGVSQWVAPSYMELVGNGTAAAIRDQLVSVIGTDLNTEHALHIVIVRGPVTLRVGSTVGGDEYIRETVLNTGTHSLALTPTGNFNIRFLSRRIHKVWIDSCVIESAGVMTVTTPWLSTDLNNIRIDQSGDIIFVACTGYQQRRIERRSTRSWSVALYVTEDGPFMTENVSSTTLTPNALTGNITIASSIALFRATHVGALFSLTSVGQTVTKSITAENVFSDSIRVTGVGTDRTFTIVISNVFTATVTLQRSLDSSTGPWSDVSGETWTVPVTTSYLDALDNQIAYYRIGVKTGGFTVGTADVRLSIGSGSITGIVRITDFTSSILVGAEVLKSLGGTTAVTTWSEGEWSDFRGWPTSLRFHEGRLCWAGRGGIWDSISDAFDSFDDTFTGDAGPINRTIGSGPVDTINWILSLQRMILGAQGSEISVRASSLDEPLTPTNFNMKRCSTQGSSAVQALELDQNGIFIHRNGVKVYQLTFALYQTTDYLATDLTALVPELGSPGIVRMAIQRQPDTRIHCIRSDGVALVCVHDTNEDVLAWDTLTSDGTIEDVVILPAISGNIDDQVYYVVKRIINGLPVRYLEKWAQETECRGNQQLCKLADSFVIYSGIATTVITGLSHLEGKNVVVWADGADVGTNDSSPTWTQIYTVNGGQITLTTAASNVVVGLPYTAAFLSTKLGTVLQGFSPLNKTKTIDHLGIIARDIHAKGLRFGPNSSILDDLPSLESGTIVSGMRTAYDQPKIEFPGTWTTDARLYLQAQAPRPCTLLAATIDLEE